MEKAKYITVTARLDRLALRYDYTIVCDSIKNKPVPVDDEGRVKWMVELTNPIEYTMKELLEKYDGSTRISRWIDTYTEKGEPAMAVVIEKEA